MARSFNGTSSTAQAAALALSATDNLSFGGWLNPANVTQANAILFYNGDNGSNGYGLELAPAGGTLSLLLGGINILTTGASVAAGDWYHALAVRSAGTWSFYLNGAATPSTYTTAPNAPNSRTFLGSNLGGAAQFFNGLLAEWAAWGRPLSAAEAAALAAGGSPGQLGAGPLAAWWPLCGRSSPEPDASGNRLALTLTAAAPAPHPPAALPNSPCAAPAPPAPPAPGPAPAAPAPLDADTSTEQAAQALWAQAGLSAALSMPPPFVGRGKGRPALPYASLESKLERRRLAGTASAAHFDWRRVTITLFGTRDQVNAGLVAVRGAFNSDLGRPGKPFTLTYPDADPASGLPRFLAWVADRQERIEIDPETRDGQDVWRGVVEGLAWSVRAR